MGLADMANTRSLPHCSARHSMLAPMMIMDFVEELTVLNNPSMSAEQEAARSRQKGLSR